VVLLIGSVGGLAMASLAGARRTDSSFPTYLASTNPSTLGVFTRYDDPGVKIDTGYNAHLQKTVAHLPLVTRSATAIIFDANINLNGVKGIHYQGLAGESPPTIIGSPSGEFTSMDRVSVIAGRMPNPRSLDEAVMNPQAAQQLGVRIGSVITMPFYTDKQSNSNSRPSQAKIVRVKIVGVVVASRNVVESDIDSLGASAVIFSQALTRELAPQYSTGTETYLQIKGGTANAKRVLDEVYKVDPFSKDLPSELSDTLVPAAQQAISPEAVALGVFGALAALSTLLIAALMIGRLLRARQEELEALRALGASRAMLMGDGMLSALLAVFAGSLLAVVVAVALSPLSPLGPVRPIYPHSGVAFDWTVLGFGVLVLVVVLGVMASAVANREIGRITSRRFSGADRPEAPWLRSVANSGLPIAVVTGVRFALEPGRGRNVTPVRSAVLGTVLAVTVLVATVTFGASLDSLVSKPALYGWNWNYAMLAGFAGAEDLPGHQIAKFLNEDHDVSAWSGVYFADSMLDGQRVGTLVERPGAAVAPPVLSGHGLEAANQVVLGTSTLSQLHKKVGDTVTFSNGQTKSRTLTIVGTGTVPALSSGAELGQGAMIATSNFPTALLNLQDATIPGPNAILVRIKSGVTPAAAYASLRIVEHQVNAIPQARGLTGGIVKLLRPADIVNFRSMGTIPDVLAGGLAVGAVMALGLTLVASVRRRRRDLAMLKALGFTQRQLAASIAWQSTVAALIGCVVGIPLGIVVGRQLWDLFARSISAVPSPTVPILWVVLVGVGALLFANLVAALPGRIAARTPTALVLRAE
jgi:ABC-type antimicrobial peptide transport system permease subunit